LSIVPLTILAVMWAAFLLPLIVPGQHGQAGWLRRGAAAAGADGWRPAGSGQDGPGQLRDTRRRLARRRAVLRRRRVLLALTIAVVAAVRAWYLLGGRWWVAEAVTGALLLAYLCALVAQGWRRRRRQAQARARAHASSTAQGARRRRWLLRNRRHRQTDLPLWGAPLLEGQAPAARPE
jgi:hypothetical protein